MRVKTGKFEDETGPGQAAKQSLSNSQLRTRIARLHLKVQPPERTTKPFWAQTPGFGGELLDLVVERTEAAPEPQPEPARSGPQLAAATALAAARPPRAARFS